MRIFKINSLLKVINGYLIDSSQPSNISYAWNFGSLLAVCLMVQIVTGVTLSMHYNSNVFEAFNSVEHVMRDVNNGWLIRYLHANTASAFFFLVYLHIGRGLYYGSYKFPRTLVWTIGTTILILMMAIAFLGYVLPYGQMSLWGATVITNLMSAIPWVGQDIVEFIWGGFSVNNATLNRFFALHFVLPFVLAALVLMHLIVLHDSAGSGNPLGVTGNYDRLPFAPYYIFKDLITIFIFVLALSLFVFFMPNVLGDSENYVMANPMQTPPAIVPEWYLLPFYAILRSIPNKLLGVIAMFSAILIILTMSFTDLSRSRGIQFRPLSKIAFFVFLGNFLILMKLGAKHVESPFIEFGLGSTALYFSYFLIIVPVISMIENSLVDVSSVKDKYYINSKLYKYIKPDYAYSSYTGSYLTTVYNYFVYNKFIYVLHKTYINFCAIVLSFSCLLVLIAFVNNLYTEPYIQCDAPRPWGLYFQDSGTPQMEGLVELHDNILFYLVIILFAVIWIIVSIFRMNTSNSESIPHKFLGHGTFVELVWTITPALILILITFPSFKLLFLMDEVSDPAMAILAEGHQWYWSYQYPDFTNDDNEPIEFDSYLVPESDLDEGALRMLEVDNRIIIPELTHVRFLVTAADVIHSFACPSLGVKCDAYPGRLNQVSFMLNREGIFYGQCSEICGLLHSSMPIVFESISVDKFVYWLLINVMPIITMKRAKTKNTKYNNIGKRTMINGFTNTTGISVATGVIVAYATYATLITIGGIFAARNHLNYPDPFYIPTAQELLDEIDTRDLNVIAPRFAPFHLELRPDWANPPYPHLFLNNPTHLNPHIRWLPQNSAHESGLYRTALVAWRWNEIFYHAFNPDCSIRLRDVYTLLITLCNHCYALSEQVRILRNGDETVVFRDIIPADRTRMITILREVLHLLRTPNLREMFTFDLIQDYFARHDIANIDDHFRLLIRNVDILIDLLESDASDEAIYEQLDRVYMLFRSTTSVLCVCEWILSTYGPRYRHDQLMYFDGLYCPIFLIWSCIYM